jgi:hypothetical protein
MQVRSAGMLQQLLDLGGPGAVVAGVGVVPELHGDFSLNGTQLLVLVLVQTYKKWRRSRCSSVLCLSCMATSA